MLPLTLSKLLKDYSSVLPLAAVMGTLSVSPDPQQALLSQQTLERAESHGQRLTPSVQHRNACMLGFPGEPSLGWTLGWVGQACNFSGSWRGAGHVRTVYDLTAGLGGGMYFRGKPVTQMKTSIL